MPFMFSTNSYAPGNKLYFAALSAENYLVKEIVATDGGNCKLQLPVFNLSIVI